MSATREGANVAAIGLCIALLIVLFKAGNMALRFLCIAFIAILIGLLYADYATSWKQFHIVRYFVLFIGEMNCLFSIWDIYDDLISRRVNSSDAEMFAQQFPIPCCTGLCWGILWGIMSMCCALLAVYLSLVILE
eukprot:TRINITY_DN6865_c0_g1_i1.p1 TRINITY_DN6865_c0_g1~~TRINITY_DN6865_c0_g1_i1.p1  ORF type:complete len:157 (-),score=19.97 TRINITY_DN6865_c0_g1_i1:134-538(-)